RDTTFLQFLPYAFSPDLIQLVDRHECFGMMLLWYTCRIQDIRKKLTMIEPDDEIFETKPTQDLRDSRYLLRLDHHRTGTDRVNVALIELPKASAGGAVGTPHRLDLIAFEELG